MVYVYLVAALVALAGSFVAGALYGRKAYAASIAEADKLKESAKEEARTVMNKWLGQK